MSSDRWHSATWLRRLSLSQPRSDPHARRSRGLVRVRSLGQCQGPRRLRKLTAERYVAEPVPGWSSVRSTISHIALATEFNLHTLASDPDDRIRLRSRSGHGGRRGPVAGTCLPPLRGAASRAHAAAGKHRADAARGRLARSPCRGGRYCATLSITPATTAVRTPPSSNGSGSNNPSRTSSGG